MEIAEEKRTWITDLASRPFHDVERELGDDRNQGIAWVIVGTLIALAAGAMETHTPSEVFGAQLTMVVGLGYFAAGTYWVVSATYRRMRWNGELDRRDKEQMRRLDEIIAGFDSNKKS